MRNSTSSLLKGILASGASVALALCGMLPAAAHPHGNSTRSTSAPARAAAPARASAPVRRYSSPRVQHYAAPVMRRYAAPVTRHYAAPVTRHYAAPVTRHYAAPVTRHYAAPARITRHYAAPRRIERYAPVRAMHVQRSYAAPAPRARYRAPFTLRVAPERNVRSLRAPKAAPFVQYVRSAPRVRRTLVRRTVSASPLVRSVYVSRARSIPVVYHPRYIAGRVARVRSNEVVIDPPAGSPVIVRDVVAGTAAPAIPVGTYVTMPVTYANGYYTYAPPVYTNYAYDYGSAPQYGYAPQYQYAYAPPMYCSGNSSSALYAALLPAVVGMLTGNSNSLNSNDLTSLALTAATSGNSCQNYAPGAYYSQPAYTAPLNYGPTAYATPYGSCLAGDEDGDENCAPASGYTYDTYSMYGGYAPQQVQGVVIGRSGDLLMVLGANGTPTYVYAAPALQSGYTVNGPIQPGQIVDAYGYYSGSTFIATALV